MHLIYHSFSLYLLLFYNNERHIIGLSVDIFIPIFNLNYFFLFSAELSDLEFCFGLEDWKTFADIKCKRESEFLVLSAIHDFNPVFCKLDIFLATLKRFRPKNYMHSIYFNSSWCVVRQKRRKWEWDPQRGTLRAYKKDQLILVGVRITLIEVIERL
jgi:hypothetical protein